MEKVEKAEKVVEKAVKKAEKAVEKAEKAAARLQFDAARQVVPFKQHTTYMTADGVAKVSAFGGYDWVNEHLVAARRQTFLVVCEGMSDHEVLDDIDTGIHALRILLYSYRYVDGRWHLMPSRSRFPLMLNLHLSAESRRAIVHDVQDWYNDPDSKHAPMIVSRRSPRPAARPTRRTRRTWRAQDW